MSDELTAEQVKAMLERAEASAPGPWAILPPILKDDDPGHWNIPISAPDYCLPAHCYGNKYRAANAAFIASTRADVPALCRSWLAQDAELAALRAKLATAIALADTGSVEHRARFGWPAEPRITLASVPGWRVIEAMRETLIGG